MTLPLCSIETGSPAWLSFIKSLLQNDDFAAPISHDGPSLADGGSPRRAIHGRSSCQRHPVVTDRAIAAARQTATPPLSWPEAVASAQSPHRHSLRIENRHCLERSAMRNGLRLGRYLLALSSCLERSEEHTSELQSRQYLVCRLLLEKKKKLKKRSTLIN